MEYNTSRKDLVIPEYGRNIHQMIEHACTIEDREERNRAANTIIRVMGQLNPNLRDVDEFTHKLWAQMFMISGYKLDVDSPFPKPEPEAIGKRPERLEYPKGNLRFKHYGRTVELLIAKAIQLEDPEEKNAMTEAIANLMKRSYLSWNRDSVNDQVIFDHLDLLSKGKLSLREGFQLDSTSDILVKNKKPKKGKSNSHKKKKKH